MTQTNPTLPFTRDHVLQMLSDGEFASFSNAKSDPPLRRGELYLDLSQLALGVQRSDGALSATAEFLARNAIHEDTWRRILRQLKAASATPT